MTRNLERDLRDQALTGMSRSRVMERSVKERGTKDRSFRFPVLGWRREERTGEESRHGSQACRQPLGVDASSPVSCFSCSSSHFPADVCAAPSPCYVLRFLSPISLSLFPPALLLIRIVGEDEIIAFTRRLFARLSQKG